MKLNGQRSYAATWLVGDNLWDLKFVKTAGDSDSNRGLCDPSNRTVYVLRGMDRGEIFRTFLHEILHAIEFENEIDIKHEIIEKLEDGIADFILENFLALSKIFTNEKNS